MPTTEELIADINQQPCNEGEVQQSITNITNVLNNVSGGVIIARCTLTSDNLTCAPELLAVSGFTPLVKDFSAYGIDVPVQARQYLGIATHDARTGYIIYNWDALEWEVFPIEQSLRQNYVRTVDLTGKVLTLPYDVQSVNECGTDGQDQVTFSTATVDVVSNLHKDALSPIEWDIVSLEVWGSTPAGTGSIATVIKSAIRDIYKENCTIYMQERDLEVFAFEDDPAEYEAVVFDDEVLILYNLYASGGYIWGDFQSIFVPCTGNTISLALLEWCCDSSGGVTSDCLCCDCDLYTFTVTGTDCPELEGAYTLGNTMPCRIWGGSNPAGTFAILTVEDNCDRVLTIGPAITGGSTAFYRLSEAEWDCQGTNTMAFESSTGTCTGWPATLDVTCAD